MIPLRSPIRLKKFLFLCLTTPWLACFGFVAASQSNSEDPARAVGIVDCSNQIQEHDPDIIAPSDRVICFDAYVSNFDTTEHMLAGGKNSYYGIPHWVAQHVKRARRAPESHDRPRKWFTIPELRDRGIAPTDDSYHFSEGFLERHSNWYQRGHLAQKYLAERRGHDAAWFTHNVANAVPQRARFNREPWLSLECYTGALANRYGEVWIVSGPIFSHAQPTSWLKSDIYRKALRVAVPDQLFKVVVRKITDNAWETRAFAYPQDDPSYYKRPYDPVLWLTSLAQIEKLTGQKFFPKGDSSVLPKKEDIPASIWAVDRDDFDPGCRQFAKDVS